VPFFNRDSLCGGGSTVCTAEEWVARRGAQQPFFNYWIDDRLRRGGDVQDCYATENTAALGCGVDDPMRVCAGSFDGMGNGRELTR
jgi:hypothetical protein